MQIPKQLPLWINGKEVLSDKTYSNLNPYNEEVLCNVSIATDYNINTAMNAAVDAQKKWAKNTPKERAAVLRKTAQILSDQNDELARIETLDTGRVIRETTNVDIISACDCLNYIASLIETKSSRHIPLDELSFAYTIDQPLGLCLGIGAWNYPIQVATWKAAPAIAMGNSFIFKPSELSPISAYFLAKAFQKAGLPDGVFQVLYGDGSVGEKLVQHPKVNKVSLTGSVPTGKVIYQNAAKSLKKVSLELGGKSPLIIFEDANIDSAVQASMLANFYSQGEICSNGTRVFVQKNIKDKFLEKLLSQTNKIIIGDPLSHETHLGPMISKDHKEKVLSFINRAINDGVKVECGAKEAHNTVLPTVFTNCNDELECIKEEIFGPVLSILEFEDEEEVITRSNNTSFGLAGAVFTSDISRAHRVVKKLEVGVSWINAYNLTPVEMPFGGAKLSGLGMENGHEVLKEYSRIQSVYVNLSDKSDSFF